MFQKSDFNFNPSIGLMYKENIICNFDVKVDYRVVDIVNSSVTHSNVVGYVIAVTIASTYTDELRVNREFVVDYKKCEWASLFPGCIDACMTDKDKKYLNTYIQYQLCDCPITYYITNTGFYPGIGYVIDSKTLIPMNTTGVAKIEYIPAENIPKYNELTELSEGECINYFKRLMEWNENMVPISLWWFLSIIKPILYIEGCKLSGILGVIGGSGSLKTSITRIFAETESKFINLNKGLCSKLLSQYRHSIILVDDYKDNPQKHVRDRFKTVNEYLIRSQDNCDAPLVITTGEMLDGDYSTQDRVIQLHLDKKRSDYNEDELRELKWLQDNAHYMKAFRRILIKKIYGNENMFNLVRNYIKRNKECLLSTTKFRISELCSYLRLASDIFNNIFKENIIADISILERINAKQKKYMQLLSKYIEGDYSYIISWLYCNNRIKVEDTLKQQTSVGYHNGNLCIEKDALIYIFESFLTTRVNYKAVINHLRFNKLIICDNSRAASKKIEDEKKYLGRYIHFDVKQMKYYYQTHQ